LEAETTADLLDFRHGSTDSELVFYWLLGRLRAAGVSVDGSQPSAVERVAEVMAQAIPDLAARSARAAPGEPARLNFVLSDGRVLLASRWNHTLFWKTEESAASGRAVSVASEPTDDQAWKELPDRVILGIDAQITPRLTPLASI
jgi:hypothetical protein